MQISSDVTTKQLLETDRVQSELPWWTSIKVNALPVLINSGKSSSTSNGKAPTSGDLAMSAFAQQIWKGEKPSAGVGAGLRLNDEELQEFTTAAMMRLRAKLTEANILDPVVITEDEADLWKLRDEIPGGVDVILPLTAGNIYHHGWRHSTPVEVKFDIVGKPILRVAYMVWDFLGLDVVAALKAQGHEAYFAASLDRANQILRIMRVKKALERTRIAIVGKVKGRSLLINDGVPSNIVDPTVIKAKTLVDAEFFPDALLKEMVESVDRAEAEAVAEQWAKEATAVRDLFRPGETAPRWVTYQAQLYLGLKQLLAKYNFTAISGCFDPGHLFDPDFTAAPCFAFVKLKDEGFPCGCEGDQNALLASIMLMYLSGAPADMGNTVIPTYTDDHMEDWQVPNPEENVIVISHSVTPTRMAGFDRPADHFSLCGTHCSSCFGINSYVELKEGQAVTIARLSPRAERILIAEGRIVRTEMTPVEGNRNAVYIEVKDRDDFFDKQSLVGNHLSFVYGHVGDDLAAVCKSLGIEPIFA